MFSEQSAPEDPIKACLEASFYLSARRPRVIRKELVEIFCKFGRPAGAAGDAVRAVTHQCYVAFMLGGGFFSSVGPVKAV